MNVIIAGAGISGLAAAISLRRSGHRVTIYERSSGNNEVGAAINVPPNAGRFLIPWGLDPVKFKFVKSNGMYFISPTTLDPIQSFEYSPTENEYVQPLYYAHRVDLHESLRQLATESSGVGNPVTIHLKKGVVSYDPVTPSVTLQDGTVVSADLVIAADGIHSVAAKLVNEETKPPQVAKPANCCYRFLISRADVAADPKTAWFNEEKQSLGTRIYPDLAGHRRIVNYSCRNYEVHNFVGICHNDNMGNTIEDWHADVDKSEVLEIFAGYHPKLLEIISSKATIVKRWPLLYRPPLDKWTKGKLTLLGDAAHPMLPHQGQGGAQGMEDGLALGLAMYGVTDPSQIEERLALYEKIRRNRAASIQILSNFGADEETPPELADFLEGHPMPTSVKDIKQIAFGADVLQRIVDHMTKFDPVSWRVPDNFFPAKLETKNQAQIAAT